MIISFIQLADDVESCHRMPYNHFNHIKFIERIQHESICYDYNNHSIILNDTKHDKKNIFQLNLIIEYKYIVLDCVDFIKQVCQSREKGKIMIKNIINAEKHHNLDIIHFSSLLDKINTIQDYNNLVNICLKSYQEKPYEFYATKQLIDILQESIFQLNSFTINFLLLCLLIKAKYSLKASNILLNYLDNQHENELALEISNLKIFNLLTKLKNKNLYTKYNKRNFIYYLLIKEYIIKGILRKAILIPENYADKENIKKFIKLSGSHLNITSECSYKNNVIDALNSENSLIKFNIIEIINIFGSLFNY